MTRHVGVRVSALVDGQLPPDEAERLWSHVHVCPDCRARVEHEGWVKTMLAGLALSGPGPTAPQDLKGSLAGVSSRPFPTAPVSPAPAPATRRRTVGIAVLGAGSIGAAMVGVLALTVPAQTPGNDRRGPVTSLTRPTVTPIQTTTPRTRSPLSAALQLAQVGAEQQEWVTITP